MNCAVGKIKGVDIPIPGISSPLNSIVYAIADLGLADSEHLGATGRACALGGRLAVLHGNAFSVFHFFLGLALYTISLHVQASSRSFDLTIYYLTHPSQANELSRAK